MELFKLFGTIAINNNEANQAIDNTTDKAESGSGRIIGALKKIGGVVATAFAVDKIIDFGKTIVDAAATVGAEQSAFEQIMGDYSKTAQEKVNEIADATGMVSTRLTPYMTSMTAKFKGLGFDIGDATDLASDGLTLAADAAAFWDKSLDDSMGALNSFVNGSYEGGEAIGLFANDTQMAQYAIQQGLVGTSAEWAALDEATKQATRLEYAKAMYEQSGATGQAAKEATQYANVQANLTEKWRQFKAQIGDPVLQNIVLPAMENLSGLVDTAGQKFQQLKTWVSDNQSTLERLSKAATDVGTAIGIASAAFAGFKIGSAIQGAVRGFQQARVTLALFSATSNGATIAQGLFNGSLKLGEVVVGLFTGKVTLAELASAGWAKAQAILNAVLSANPIALVVAAIAALVAIFVVAYNKSETFRDFVNQLWSTIKDAFSTMVQTIKSGLSSVGEFFSNIWTSITTFVSSAWETIKNVVQVGIMFIGEVINAAITIITLPFQFIWQNCKDIIMTAWNTIKTTVSNAVNAIKNTVTNVWNAISGVISTVLNVIKGVVSGVWNEIKSVISSVLNNIKSVVSSIWNGIKTVVTNVVNNIKTVVTNVFNAVKTAISTPLNAAKTTVGQIFDSIKKSISDKINSAKDTVKSAIDKIKGFFNFSWSLPRLKLPHVSISGSFSLVPPSVPHFSVDWYKKGGIMTEPTMFDYNPATGKAKVGGEAGDEAVAPIDLLMGYIRTAVQEENTGLVNALNSILGELKLLNNTLYEKIVTALTNGVELEWQDRELARMVRKYA